MAALLLGAATAVLLSRPRARLAVPAAGTPSRAALAALLAGLAVWAFRTALAGRKLLRDDTLG